MHLPLESLETTVPERQERHPMKTAYLDCLAIALQAHTHKTYPSPAERLFSTSSFINTAGLVALPNNGPWVAGAVFPTHAEKYHDVIAMIGYPKQCTLDADYRPLHPWWRDMVKRPDIGGVIGRGFYYHWGANYTADAAVTTTDTTGTKILLIRRKDTGDWALPGGFIDDRESSKHAALRELAEEAAVVLPENSTPARLLYRGPVLDNRTTLHAWAETSLWYFNLPSGGALPTITGGDDASDAAWFNVANLPSNLYGSHPVLLEAVLTNLALETKNYQAGAQFPL